MLIYIAQETLGFRRSRFSRDSRYSYRHSHFCMLHHVLQHGFTAKPRLTWHAKRSPTTLALWARKSEIQNPKSETNYNFQNTKFKTVFNFEHLNFDIVSNFDIRASNFLVQSTRFRLFPFRSPLLRESLLARSLRLHKA